jgi:hypothetical protein
MSQSSIQFEKDVWAFVKSLDSSAQVLFDHTVLDKDTGTPRQVDAWVNAKFGGHIPISILVSCKQHGRKLNITHIDSFAAEVRATGASTGVIYSSAGFSGPALKKANAHGLACCRLFRNQSGEVPQSLVFWYYFCGSHLRLKIPDDEIGRLMQRGITTWKALLSMRTCEGGILIDEIAEESRKKEQDSVKGTSIVPPDWAARYRVSPVDDPAFTFRLIIMGWWEVFRARLECYLIDGSYCYSDGSFRGSVRSPVIDTWSTHPGPGWERIERDQIIASPVQAAIIRGSADIKGLLRQSVAEKPLMSPREVCPSQ